MLKALLAKSEYSKQNGFSAKLSNVIASPQHHRCVQRFRDSVYRRHSELTVKYNVDLKTLLQQGISEPVFYDDLVYKFQRNIGKYSFHDQFKKIIKH